MIVCYIAGKYSDSLQYKVKENIWIAEKLGMDIIERFGHRGVMVIVPHTNTAHWEGIQSDAWFYQATEELLKRSDVLIYVPGDIERSIGTKNEVEYCKKTCKPFFSGDQKGMILFNDYLVNLKISND